MDTDHQVSFRLCGTNGPSIWDEQRPAMPDDFSPRSRRVGHTRFHPRCSDQLHATLTKELPGSRLPSGLCLASKAHPAVGKPRFDSVVSLCLQEHSRAVYWPKSRESGITEHIGDVGQERSGDTTHASTASAKSHLLLAREMGGCPRLEINHRVENATLLVESPQPMLHWYVCWYEITLFLQIK